MGRFEDILIDRSSEFVDMVYDLHSDIEFFTEEFQQTVDTFTNVITDILCAHSDELISRE